MAANATRVETVETPATAPGPGNKTDGPWWRGNLWTVISSVAALITAVAAYKTVPVANVIVGGETEVRDSSSSSSVNRYFTSVFSRGNSAHADVAVENKKRSVPPTSSPAPIVIDAIRPALVPSPAIANDPATMPPTTEVPVIDSDDIVNERTLAPGVAIPVQILTPLHFERVRAGTDFEGRTTQSIHFPDGTEALPIDTAVRGRIVSARAGEGEEPPVLEVMLISVLASQHATPVRTGIFRIEKTVSVRDRVTFKLAAGLRLDQR